MPFAAYTSDWPAFLQGLVGILAACLVLVLADIVAKLLLRLPPVGDMSVRSRKILGVVGLFGGMAVALGSGVQEQPALVIAGGFVGIASFLFAVRADRS